MEIDIDKGPFTYKLSNILLAIVGLYVVMNVIFITYCSSKFYFSTEDMICRISHSFKPLSTIPVIAHPVKFLKENNGESRANVVEYDYLFSWGTAIASAAIMIFVTIIFVVRLDEDDRRHFKFFIEKNERQLKYQIDSQKKWGIYITFIILSLAIFFDAFWGYANTVHVRDRDLYRITIDWFFLLLFGMFFLISGAKTIALRKSNAE